MAGRLRPPYVHATIEKRGLHAVGSAARSARAARTDRTARRHRRAGMDAAGRSLREPPARSCSRPNCPVSPATTSTFTPKTAADRHSRSSASERTASLRAVSPGRTRTRPLLARLPAARTDRHRWRHRRSQGRAPDGDAAKGRRARDAPRRSFVKFFARALLSLALLAAGYAVGLVVSGRAITPPTL